MRLKRMILLLCAALAAPAFASGGGTTFVNPLPSTPPSPDIVLRESFGPGLDPDFVRPHGGKGDLRTIFAGTNLAGFWVEYPGSKSMAWATPDTGPGWHFAYASLNPYEIPSPIQPDPFNGVVISEWRDGLLAFPDALIPFRGLGSRYAISAEMYPGVVTGGYVALGLTSSGALQSNLAAGGQVWLLLSQVPPFTGMSGYYELRAGSQVLASGSVVLDGFNPVSLVIDPVAQTVSATVNGIDLGTYPARVGPSFLALEGQGWVDDLIVRALP